MKNHDEMTKAVFERIHEYEAVKSVHRRRNIAVICPVCAAAIVGTGLWHSGILTPPPEISEENQSYIVSATANEEVTSLTAAVTTYASKATETAVKKAAETTAQTEKNDIVSTETDETSAEFDEISESETETPAAEATAEEKPVISTKITTKPVTTARTTAAKTEAVTTQTAAVTTMPEIESLAHMIPVVEYNGVTYAFCRDSSPYTAKECIGKASDFQGQYRLPDQWEGFCELYCDDLIYTVNETNDILLAVCSDGTSFAMIKFDFSE